MTVWRNVGVGKCEGGRLGAGTCRLYAAQYKPAGVSVAWLIRLVGQGKQGSCIEQLAVTKVM